MAKLKEIADINPFVRFASVMYNWVNHFPVKAYDDRLLYILEGEGDFLINDSKYEFKKNSLFYYPAGVVYEMIPKTNMSFISINFDFFQERRAWNNVMPPVRPEKYDEKKAIFSFEKLDCQVFREEFYINEAAKFKEPLKAIVENWTSDSLCSKIISSAILKQALVEIIQYQQGGKYSAIFKKIEEYVDENYDKNINNISIAKELSYHPNYLNSVVKGATGHSFRKYIIDVRIRKAAIMLSKGMGVADVAERTGFYDASHLCVCFKKYYGIPPSQYPRAVL